MRRERLSYQVIKIQRNKYVGFLVIFTFLSNMVYFWLKNKRYHLQQEYEGLLTSQEIAKSSHSEFFD